MESVLNPLDWSDAGRLRERLAEVRAKGNLPWRQRQLEDRIVSALASITGETPEAIRATADADAEVAALEEEVA